MTKQKDGNAECQVQSDGKTVWVNASDGSCIGRFGHMGVDIHRRTSEQSTKGECLCCTHGPTGVAEWRLFVDGMLEHHGVDVNERHCPTRLRQEIPDTRQEQERRKDDGSESGNRSPMR